MGRKRKEYICKRCNYTTNRKSNYEDHVNRKIKCKLKCEFCSNSVKNLNTHLKVCKVKNQVEEYQLKIDKLREKLEEEREYSKKKDETIYTLVKQSDDLKESIKINMTMNNYFIVNPYGKESLDYIDYDKLLNDYETLSQMVAKHIQLKHFSEHKKNHNLILNRNNYQIYKKDGIWETKDKVNLFIVNDLIKKGVIVIDDYKKDENIKFEIKKEKSYKKDKKSLLRNIPLSCMFNPVEANKRLNHVKEQKENEKDEEFMDKWNDIEKKYKKEAKTAKKQAEVKQALVYNLNNEIKKKNIKAYMVKYKNY